MSLLYLLLLLVQCCTEWTPVSDEKKRYMLDRRQCLRNLDGALSKIYRLLLKDVLEKIFNVWVATLLFY